MTTRQCPDGLNLRTAVRQVHLEHVDDGLTGLDGYQQALAIFRLRGTPIGQVLVPVSNGQISGAALRAHLPAFAWAFWQQLTVLPEVEPTQPLPTASVVVCTRDRPADLVMCLPGLQRLAEQGHEVIVVDSCPSDDKTALLVAGYPLIRYLREPRPGAGIARNVGLLAATHDVVAFTDDDAQVDAEWLSRLLRNFDDPMVAVVTGMTLPLELETDAQRWFERTNGFSRGFARKCFDATDLDPLAAGLVGASVNVGIRRRALDEIGLFDEALGPGTLACSGEDHEFFYRALTHGYRVVYEPAALVWHRHRRDWPALRRAIHGYGVGVFAWWTRALLIEREWTLLKIAPRWFYQHHVRNLVRSLFRRHDCNPLDLSWAEFWGALVGPVAYVRSRWRLRHPSSPASSHNNAIAPTRSTPSWAVSTTMKAR